MGAFPLSFENQENDLNHTYLGKCSIKNMLLRVNPVLLTLFCKNYPPVVFY